MVLYQWIGFGNGEIKKNYLYMSLSSHVGVSCRFMMDFPISLLVYWWGVMQHRIPAPCVILKNIQYTPINLFLGIGSIHLRVPSWGYYYILLYELYKLYTAISPSHDKTCALNRVKSPPFFMVHQPSPGSPPGSCSTVRTSQR